MEIHNNQQTFYAKSRKEWRKWLDKNHQSEKSVWLIIYNKVAEVPGVSYTEAVEEALCYGWIDSKANKRDEQSHYQYFSKRNPKSKWSAINKVRIKKLLEQNLMAPAGLEMVTLAKETGTWAALEDADNIILPAELKKAFVQNKGAKANWDKFSRSSKRIILEWILDAKREETRAKRIDETAVLAAKNIRAHYPKP